MHKQTFFMLVQNTFHIRGRGMVVTGKIDEGYIAPGDTVQISGRQGVYEAVVAQVEVFRKKVDLARAGDEVGLLLKGIAPYDIRPGDRVVRKEENTYS
jgi:elongation factor Tu